MRVAAVALSIFAIHLLGDVPSPFLIGLLSDSSSLDRAILMVPISVVVAGAVWTLAAFPRAPRRPGEGGVRKGSGDLRVEAAILARLSNGPAPVEDLVAAARAAPGAPLRRREGAFHAILLRLGREGRVRARGTRPPRRRDVCAKPRTPRGDGFPAARAAPDDPAPRVRPRGARRPPASRRGTNDHEAAGRLASDVVAHWDALGAGAARAFGSAKAACALVARVSKGRAAFCAPAGASDHLRRLLVHEGPTVLATLAFLFLVKTFVAEPRSIPSNSMRPTLAIGDRLIVWKWGAPRMPDRWDVVILLRHPHEDKVLVKRAVGLGGESISIEPETGDVFADGRSW